jgi:predicted amidophosphoribosyltransferase
MAIGFLSGIADLFFPQKCTFCRKGLKNSQSGICPECDKSLPYTGSGGRQKGEFYALCVSPLYYTDNARKAVMRFKFNGKTNYARTFGTLLAECIRQNLAGRYDLISWVPLSGRKLKKRGYAQAALLAMAAALALDDVAVDLLDKPKDTPSQSTLKGGAQEKRM